jgi:hypothetical protein
LKSEADFHRSRKQQDAFGVSMPKPVENLLMTIESFSRQFRIGKKEREVGKMKLDSP